MIEEKIVATEESAKTLVYYSDCCAVPTFEDAMRGYPICSKCKTICSYLKWEERKIIN